MRFKDLVGKVVKVVDADITALAIIVDGKTVFIEPYCDSDEGDCDAWLELTEVIE